MLNHRSLIKSQKFEKIVSELYLKHNLRYKIIFNSSLTKYRFYIWNVPNTKLDNLAPRDYKICKMNAKVKLDTFMTPNIESTWLSSPAVQAYCWLQRQSRGPLMESLNGTGCPIAEYRKQPSCKIQNLRMMDGLWTLKNQNLVFRICLWSPSESFTFLFILKKNWVST